MNFCLKNNDNLNCPTTQCTLAYQINELNKHSENNKNEIFIFVEKNHVIAQPLRLKKGVSSKPSGMIVLANSYLLS